MEKYNNKHKRIFASDSYGGDNGSESPILLEAPRFLHTAKIRALQLGMSAQKCFKGNIPDNLGWITKLLYSNDFRMNSSSLDNTIKIGIQNISTNCLIKLKNIGTLTS